MLCPKRVPRSSEHPFLTVFPIVSRSFWCAHCWDDIRRESVSAPELIDSHEKKSNDAGRESISLLFPFSAIFPPRHTPHPWRLCVCGYFFLLCSRAERRMWEPCVIVDRHLLIEERKKAKKAEKKHQKLVFVSSTRPLREKNDAQDKDRRRRREQSGNAI